MLILLETPAGFALFRISDEKKLSKIDDLYEYFQSEKKLNKMIHLQDFQQFTDTSDALKSTSQMIKGKIPK